MSSSKRAHVVRRSVAIPAEVVASAIDAAPAELRGNFNRLTIVALTEYAERKRALRIAEAIEAMGQDPAIRSVCREIARDFAPTEPDGLERS